ncbi:MAG: hypothetical protein ACOCXZ_00195 [Chloroflexota bacterium]
MRRLMLMLIPLLLVIIPAAAQEDDDEDGLAASPATYTTTAHSLTGNRVVPGSGAFPDVQQNDIELPAIPAWVLGAPVGNEPVWIVVDVNGAVYGTYVGAEGAYVRTDALNDSLPPGMPPIMATDAFGSFIDFNLPENLAAYTHPSRVTERTAYITEAGRLALVDGAGSVLNLLDVNAASDLRVVINTVGQAAAYVESTDQRYVHGIMGDRLEHAAMVVLDLGTGAVTALVELPGTMVFEGLSPFWADVDGDGSADLVTTVADDGIGAQVRVYTAQGTLLATGPAIGQSNRWRHQLAWASFGPQGENLLAEVLTPHIGGVVGFFAYDGAGELVRVARAEGFSSHPINSRNLDMAVAGDFDGDGQVELVVPNQQRDEISGLALAPDYTVIERWQLPLDGQLMTNLSAVTLPDGGLALAAGVQGYDGVARLRLWRP